MPGPTLPTDLDICMTTDPDSNPFTPRREWLAVLARASLLELEALAPRPETLSTLTYVREAETGMVMLRGRVGGTGDAFNLGEASVTRCALRLADGPLGVGYTLGRSRRKAELVAVFDALLQDPGRHPELRGTVIAPLAERQAQGRDKASRAAAQSRVEFFTVVRGDA
jgi:alpha-D-ribose 1-methylphosphonate 5-triphosphate synthase subunit PhnG